jgi:hypothetical protein
MVDEILVVENLQLAQLKDIAAMKLAAITGRGSKKDFIEIFFYFSILLYIKCLNSITPSITMGRCFW